MKSIVLIGIPQFKMIIEHSRELDESIILRKAIDNFIRMIENEKEMIIRDVPKYETYYDFRVEIIKQILDELKFKEENRGVECQTNMK